MNLGLSLPPSYLAGAAASDEARLFHESCGEPAPFLSELRERGIRSIELRKVRAATEPETARAAAHRVWDAGLSLTVHGYLPDVATGGRLEDIFPPLAGVLELLLERREETILTLHSYRATSGEVAPLRQRTVALVRRVLEAVDRQGLPVRVALELNRAKDWVDPSYTYDSLLDMWGELAHPRVGFCWDLGHAFWNAVHREQELAAPAKFVAHVIHTHIHGLSPARQTHWPLSPGALPLDAFVGPLASSGYAGVYNLELSPERFRGEQSAREAVFESVDHLRAAGRGVTWR